MMSWLSRESREPGEAVHGLNGELLLQARLFLLFSGVG